MEERPLRTTVLAAPVHNSPAEAAE